MQWPWRRVHFLDSKLFFYYLLLFSNNFELKKYVSCNFFDVQHFFNCHFVDRAIQFLIWIINLAPQWTTRNKKVLITDFYYFYLFLLKVFIIQKIIFASYNIPEKLAIRKAAWFQFVSNRRYVVNVCQCFCIQAYS